MTATCTVPKLADLVEKFDRSNPLTLQVSGVKPVGPAPRWCCMVTNGSDSLQGIFSSQAVKSVSQENWPLKDGTRIKLLDGSINMVGGSPKLVLLDITVLETDADTKSISFETPAAKRPTGPEGITQAGTPYATPTPSEAGSFSFTPIAAKVEPLSPMSNVFNVSPPSVSEKSKPSPPAGKISGPFQPIEALNPYDSNWKIKAKVSRKYPLRTFNKAGREMKVLTIEMLDEQGTCIQATLWRDAVDRFEHILEENKVYAFHRFQVKPANKQYAAVKNDYEIHMDQRTQVEELAGVSMSNVEAKLNLVDIQDLPKHINKAAFDLMGVVLTVGQLGTVKRKQDQSELLRREVVIGDDSKLSVGVTLWGDNATTNAEALSPGMVVAITSCRASEFSGCSVSALRGSSMRMEPEHPRAEELRNWYSTAEMHSPSAFTPVGQGLANGQRAGGGGAEFRMLKDVKLPIDARVPPPDAPATVSQALITVSFMQHDQTLYYLANKDTGRKVTESGNGYVDATGAAVDSVERRYVGYCKAVDCTSEIPLNFFNPEGVQLFGMSADDIYQAKNNEEQFVDIIKNAQWSDWLATISAKSREYNGEVKMRYQISRMCKVDYAQQGRRLLDLIKAYGV